MHPAMSSHALYNQRLLLTWVGLQVAPPQSPPGAPLLRWCPLSPAHCTVLASLSKLFVCLPPPLEHKLLKNLEFYALALLCFPSA